MLLVPVCELLLFVCTAALRVGRQPRANHLPTDGYSPSTAGHPSTATATTIRTAPPREHSGISNYTFPPQTPSVTTQLVPFHQTMSPTLSASTNITTNSVTESPTTHRLNTTTTGASTTRAITTSTAALTTTTIKGLQCNCSAEGTEYPENCDHVTSQCLCKQGYFGTYCENCQRGYFMNRTGSCQTCGCYLLGAVEPQCDSTGVCRCKMGFRGDKCDDCWPGYYHSNSTGCQLCQCNNHTSNCDLQSGTCLNCQNNTRGSKCEICKLNFYRKQSFSPLDSCLPCPCSSVTSSGSCTLDSKDQPVCDLCKPEYQGDNCEQCRDGYFNSDSICVPCNCSGNESPSSAPRICHPDTGYCLNCSFNTTGSQCQHCATGFTGDARVRNCTAIVPTTPVPPSTMTPSPNITDQLPTSSTLFFSSLATPTTNSTASTSAVSWAQFNLIIFGVIITLILALLGAAGGAYTYRQYQNRKLNAPFWTIELKEDNISFSSYHDSLANVDATGLLDEEGCEANSNGQLTLNSPGCIYRAWPDTLNG